MGAFLRGAPNAARPGLCAPCQRPAARPSSQKALLLSLPLAQGEFWRLGRCFGLFSAKSPLLTRTAGGGAHRARMLGPRAWYNIPLQRMPRAEPLPLRRKMQNAPLGGEGET